MAPSINTIPIVKSRMENRLMSFSLVFVCIQTSLTVWIMRCENRRNSITNYIVVNIEIPLDAGYFHRYDDAASGTSAAEWNVASVK